MTPTMTVHMNIDAYIRPSAAIGLTLLVLGGASSRHYAARAPDPANGAQVYTTCAACHQATGEGMGAGIPPLAGSEWVSAKPDIPIRIILSGLTGQISVKGRPFTGVMPPFGASLSDAQIAAVVTYVRSQWGNRSPAVTESQVKAVRAATTTHTGSWTADELKKLM